MGHGVVDPLDPDVGGQRVVEVLQYTAQFNITGQPAVSLPLSWTAGGLPVGVQLVTLGIIGAYLARVFQELKGRPLYLVRETVGLER